MADSETVEDEMGSLTEGTFGGSLSDVKEEIMEQIKFLHDDAPTRQPFERIATLCERYKEAPELLDPVLSELLTPLVKWLKKYMEGGNDIVLNDTCQVLYVLLKVRGYKTVIRFFPHEVSDLEPIERVLQAEMSERGHVWQTRYVLMVWLAIVVMIPFDLATVDSQLEGADTLVTRVVNMSKHALLSTGCDQQAAAILIQKLLTRREVAPVMLPDWIEWTLATVHDAASEFDDSKVVGVLTALDGVFKTATREELLPYASRCLEVAVHVYDSASTKRRLYGVKVAQRAALALLPPRVAKWRYQRGQRSLALNLQVATGDAQQVAAAADAAEEDEEEDEEEELEFGDEVADAIELLLGAIADKDTVCRWSAAKGLGRVAMRLPKCEADDVIEAVLEMFETQRTNDQFWHGACLALGELARRGLLLPERLESVVPLVQQALGFDQRRGSHSVGAHVRDAACYVCWAFARAYTPQVMKPHVETLAVGLVKLSLFDREVNCRRAASAAFQENVGRQGSFPHGIEIVTTADFFSLGNRVAAFTSIAESVVQFDEYRQPLLEHLLEVKVCHWDEQIRALASDSIAQLSGLDEAYTFDMIMPTLLQNASISAFHLRHGSLLALATLLEQWQTSMPSSERVNTVLAECASVILKVHKKKLVRGSGGEATRAGCSKVVKALFSFRNADQEAVAAKLVNVADKKLLLKHMLDGLDVGVEALHVPIAGAIAAILDDDGHDVEFTEHADEVLQHVIEVKLAEKHPKSATQRAGYVLMLGGLSSAVYTRRWHQPVLEVVLQMCKISGDKVPEVRRNSAQAVHALTVHSIEHNCLTQEMWKKIFGTLMTALGDYTKDNRGQVGSWVRTAAIVALRDLAVQVSVKCPELWTAESASSLLRATLRLATEHLDTVRVVAIETLRGFVVDQLAHLPHMDQLIECCSEAIVDASSEQCFERLVVLTSTPLLCTPVVLGMCDSIGAPGKYTSEAATAALSGYLSDRPAAQLAVLTAVIVLLREKMKKASLCGVLVKALHAMLCADLFESVDAEHNELFMEGLAQLQAACVMHAKNLPLLVAAMSATASMVMLDEPQEDDEDEEEAKPLSKMARMCVEAVVKFGLQHEFPRVRSSTADAFYNALLVRDELWDDDTAEQIQGLLLETAWEGDLEKLQPAREQLEQLALS